MSEERRTSNWINGLVVVCLVLAGLAALVFLTPLGMFVFIPIQMQRIHRIENRMQTPEIYWSVATNLALYCQSVDLLQISNTLGASRLPQPIPQLGSPWGMFESNYAHVEFGGGFYHYGYRIRLDETTSGAGGNVWQLFFCRESSPDKLLHTVILPATARFPVSSFLRDSLAEYDSRLTKTPRDLELHKAKLSLLLQYDRTQVRPTCMNAINVMPDHWWPRLTLALLDSGAGHFVDASSNLVKFVELKPSYSRYTYLAYFYQVVDKPDDAAKAMEKAISFPVVDLEDDQNNTECRGYSAGVYLCQTGKYSTAIKLCDALLPVKDNGNYAKAALLDLKITAQAALAGRKPVVKPREDILRFNPYEKFDLHALMSP